MIIGSRIDGRLIHGQVANLWGSKLQLDRFIVIDDKVSESDVEKSGLRLATPASMRLSVLPIDRAAKQLKEDRYKSQRVMLVAKNPQVYLALVDKGVAIDKINVGTCPKLTKLGPSPTPLT